MSGDEKFVLIVGLMFAAGAWFRWYGDLFLVARRSSRARERWGLALSPVLALLLIFWVLVRFAASDVRDDPAYLGLYLLMGAAWLAIGALVLPYVGLSARDDVLERGNRAAAIPISGALLGIALCFAGGNIGEGPGWFVVIFCALLSTGMLLLAWIALGRLTGLADTITIDRDPAAGVRAAGFFTGAGLILGRAVAGTWESGASTLSDFVRNGWPVAVLLALAVALERWLRPGPESLEPQPLFRGVLPALVYLALGAAGAALAGPW
jgi:uncharacterized membrane protein YjfL (UPF0719 family)